MRKKVWCNQGDIVLVSLRDFQADGICTLGALLYLCTCVTTLSIIYHQSMLVSTRNNYKLSRQPAGEGQQIHCSQSILNPDACPLKFWTDIFIPCFISCRCSLFPSRIRVQDEKGDIIVKYTAEEARSLKNYGELPENVWSSGPKNDNRCQSSSQPPPIREYRRLV